MNIKLKTFFKIIGIVIFSIMFLVLYEIFRLYQATNKLSLIEHQRYQMTLKADELRQSSDDLTRMARTYIVTQDPKFKEAYYKILDIRDGKAPRPKHYEGIYWDLSAEKRQELHPPQKAISLEEQMRQLPYSKYELSKLKESKEKSDKLTALEKAAFNKNALTPTPKNITNLYSPSYHQAKEDIMLPIDEFLSSIRQRTRNEIFNTHKEIEKIYKEIAILFVLSIIILLSVFYVVSKKILSPIEYLHQTILAFRHGEPIEEKRFYHDEIGQMIKQFFNMKEKIDHDNKQLQHLATTDALTGIYNRRAFFEIANSFFSLAKRENSNLSIAIIDIDFFKKINDTYGHIIGDKILQHLVSTVHSSLRESDIFARYGGEEFIIMLPHTDIDSSMEVAQKIRQKVELTPCIIDDKAIFITISIGCSSYKNEDNELTDIILRADKALYTAKENGRNRVEVIV